MGLIKAIVAGACGFLLVYLLGAFVATTFDITQWTTEGRFVVAIGGLSIAILPIFGITINE